jgi:hypothetical protein
VDELYAEIGRLTTQVNSGVLWFRFSARCAAVVVLSQMRMGRFAFVVSPLSPIRDVVISLASIAPWLSVELGKETRHGNDHCTQGIFPSGMYIPTYPGR